MYTTTNAKVLKDVTLTSRRGRFTAEAGSVLKIAEMDESWVTVTFGGMTAQVFIDDAVPVAWDPREEVWVENC